MKIYTNSYIHTEDITPENFVDVFESYANRLEDMAKNYRSLVKCVKSKNIKIVEAQGTAHGGHFSVDEIDTQRLKSEGLVIDFAEQPAAENPVFYIDSVLDEVLDDTLEKLAEFDPDFEKMADNILDTIFIDEDEELEDDEEIKQIDIDFADIDDEHEEFPDGHTHFNLSEKISDFGDDSFAPGDMVIDVKKIGDNQYTFNLTMADLGESPTNVNYMRDKEIFEFECGECDATHFESLDSVYRSLKTANAVFSNLVEMTKDFRELSAALEFIDSDLRLLQWLIKFDYALEDDLPEEDEAE